MVISVFRLYTVLLVHGSFRIDRNFVSYRIFLSDFEE